MIIKMKELYNTIPSLPVTHSYPRHKRQVLLAGAVGAGLGAGVALLASLLFENPRQDQIISDLAKTTEAINMLNKDRITFQEQQIIWDNKLMNNIKNTSDRIFRELTCRQFKLAKYEQRSLLLHTIGDQKASLRTLLTQ